MRNNQNQITRRLLFILISSTFLFIFAQISFFIVHSSVTEVMDTFIKSAISSEILNKVILLPIIQYVVIQAIAYGLIVAFLFFISLSISSWLKLSFRMTYFLGIFCWFLLMLTILSFNSEYYPYSFFAVFPTRFNIIGLVLLIIITLLAYIPYFFYKQFRILGTFFLILGVLFLLGCYVDKAYFPNIYHKTNQKPNIILIGLDSLRPDFVGFYDHTEVSTPNIDAFFRTAMTFTNAYTPLARTYPSWMSVLTAKYPLHHHARVNLTDPNITLKNVTVAQQLQKAGYQTFYATDENRFSNIDQRYGFDRIIGPAMGVNDFLLGTFSDFPLNNLLLKLPFSYWLFPYQYANRAAAITYHPEHFLHLLQLNLNKRTEQPLFLAVHFCLTHWPYTWANDGIYDPSDSLVTYQNSIKATDVIFGQFMQMLKRNNLLDNALVFVISDHGTTLGLPNDRIVSEKNYYGDKNQLNLLPIYKLNSENHYSFSTSYGQGTDVLSLKQYHVLFGMKGFGFATPIEIKKIAQTVSLLDIAPTILDYLKLEPMEQIDGASLLKAFPDNPIFLETADHFSEIDTDHIQMDQVLKQRIELYYINKKNGFLFLHDQALERIIESKQRAILWHDWLLAYYPTQLKTTLQPLEKNEKKLGLKTEKLPPFYVLVNLKTKQWTILTVSEIKNANKSLLFLFNTLQEFYHTES